MSWKKFTEFLNNPIIQLLGGSGVMFVITWIITHLARLPIWEIWLAIIFVITCLVIIINQIDAWRGRHKKGLTKLSEKELENTVHQWLVNPVFSVRPMPVDNDRHFGFHVTGKSRPDIYVIRAKNEPSIIQVLSPKLMIPPMDQTVMDRVQNSLTIEMARLDVQFMYEGGGKIPPNISLMQPIPIVDELTVFEFRQNIVVVTRAAILIHATLVNMGVLTGKSPTAPTADTGDHQP
jgi:hypothetical protein